MFIFILNMAFASENLISFSACNSKIKKQCGSNKTFLYLKRVNLFVYRIFGAWKEMRPEQDNNPRVHDSFCEFVLHYGLKI